MKTLQFSLAALLAAATLLPAADQAVPSISSVFDGQLASAEKEVVSLAEAMPADKYDFAPTQGAFKGVRTFALQVRHIATTNYEMAAAVLGEKNPVAMGDKENGSNALQSKDQIVKYLKDSFVYCHKAIGTLTAANLNEMIDVGEGQKAARGLYANVPIWHSYDHYGQMVVYARMNGIVPPASR